MWGALLHKSDDGRTSPFPGADLSCDFSDGCAEGGEAVQDGDTDPDLGRLTVEVPRGQALTEEVGAVHLDFSAASAVMAAPSSPDGPTDALRSAQDVVSGDGAGGVWRPGSGVLVGRDDGGGTSGGDAASLRAREWAALLIAGWIARHRLLDSRRTKAGVTGLADRYDRDGVCRSGLGCLLFGLRP